MENSMIKDETAAALIDSAIRKGWPDIVESVSVASRIDFLGEPAFDVLFGLKSIQQVPSSIARGDMLARLSDALKEAGDERTTHIAFSAPDEVLDADADDEEEAQGVTR
jgi:hypothetical protein